MALYKSSLKAAKKPDLYRRQFCLKVGGIIAAAGLSTIVSPFRGVKKAFSADRMTLDDVMRSEHKNLQQDYLNQLHRKNANKLDYIGELRNGTVRNNQDLNVKYNGRATFITYATEDNIGNGVKPTVYTSKRAFKRYSEGELLVLLVHENQHCRDIYEGYHVGNKQIEYERLRKPVLGMITEIKAVIAEMNYMTSELQDRGRQFYDEVRPEFIEKRMTTYDSLFSRAKSAIESQSLRVYEKNMLCKVLNTYQPAAIKGNLANLHTELKSQ